MAVAEQKQNIRRSTRVLQFCSCVLLGIGLILVLPFAFITDTGLAGSFAGYFSLTAAASGLLGLYFTWQRGLVLFTVMTWTLSLETAIVMTQYVLSDIRDPWPWMTWVAVGLAALPAALLSSMMHLLRVWQGPRAQVEDNQQRAPLVSAAADLGPGMPAQQSIAPSRPVWPPPSGHAGLGADLLATGRVAAAAHSGDFSQVSARDVATAGRMAGTAASTWPPAK